MADSEGNDGASGADDPVLDLSTQLQRKTVRIDGTAYAMRHPDEFSMTDQHNFGVLARRVQKLMRKESELTDKEAAEIAKHSREMVRRIMADIDEPTLERMTDNMRMEVVNVFTRLSGVEIPQEAEPEPAE